MPDVTLLNIGRSIAVPVGQTLLSAALAQGIDYPHGCKAGRCGTCKTRLASGEVELLDHSRFALTADERESGLVLACRAVPKGPTSIAWLEDQEAAARHPLRVIEAEVAGTELLTHDILRLRLKGPELRFRFSPGQYATLELPGEPGTAFPAALKCTALQPATAKLRRGAFLRSALAGASSAAPRPLRIGQSGRLSPWQ